MRKTTCALTMMMAVGCASRPEPTRDPDVDAQLQQAMGERDQLAQQLAKDSAERQRCEFLVGDCMLMVKERRDELLQESDAKSLECDGADAEAQVRCLAKQILAHGTQEQTQRATDFFRYESECLTELALCTKGDDPVTARQDLIQERRRQLEDSQDGVAARDIAELAHAKALYLRSTLPLEDDSSCTESSVFDKCLEDAKRQLGKLDAILGRGEGYDDQAARTLYRTSKEQEAGCYDREVECLSAKTEAFGANAETRRLLKQSLSLLEERQQLASKIDPTVVAQCLADGESRHQSKITRCHRAYVQKQGTFFRYQLNQALLELHRTQVQCLRNKARSASKG